MSNFDYLFNAQWFEKNYRANPYKFQYVPKGSALIIDAPNQYAPGIPNIFIQIEPEIIKPQEDYLIENADKYSYIVTYNQKIIKACPNALWYLFGTKWLPAEVYENHDIQKKKFQISHLAGSKRINNAPGHILRQVIHHSQEKLSAFPITFFRSSGQKPIIKDHGGNPLLGEHKTDLFETYQYAFIIENSRESSFTEKLIDCLLMKTIPIYYGPSYIGSVFDTTGWIILETGSLVEIKEKLASLTPTSYANSYSVVQKNYETALTFIDLYKNIDNAFKEIRS